MSLRRAKSLLSPTALTSTAVPKQRRPKFDLRLKVLDLNNVPYVTGKSFIKWHLPHSAAAEHRGRTDRCPIKDHKVTYNYDALIPVRLVVDKNGMLQESSIHLEVLHEVVSAGKPERILLGWVKLNLAEYVEASEHDGEEAVTRRYLMQESKINSTLKICVYMKQTEGDRNFVPPPLKTATVFGGIAGIMAGEGDAEGPTHMPSVTTKAREAGEDLRELYRRTLAADSTCQPGEPSADKCVEDIFAGGDGWGRGGQHPDRAPTPPMGTIADGGSGGSDDDDDARTLRESKQRNWSGFFGRRHHHNHHHNQQQQQHHHHHQHHAKKGSRNEPLLMSDKDDDEPPTSLHMRMAEVPRSGLPRGSFEQQAAQMKREEAESRVRVAAPREIDEIEIRDDLRCWRLPKYD